MKIPLLRCNFCTSMQQTKYQPEQKQNRNQQLAALCATLLLAAETLHQKLNLVLCEPLPPAAPLMCPPKELLYLSAKNGLHFLEHRLSIPTYENLISSSAGEQLSSWFQLQTIPGQGLQIFANFIFLYLCSPYFFASQLGSAECC